MPRHVKIDKHIRWPVNQSGLYFLDTGMLPGYVQPEKDVHAIAIGCRYMG